jgi:hypothetical protein
MRVIANGTGSEVIFTLFRHPDMTEEAFASAPGGLVLRELRDGRRGRRPSRPSPTSSRRA